MRRPRSIQERNKDREESRSQLQERIKRLAARRPPDSNKVSVIRERARAAEPADPPPPVITAAWTAEPASALLNLHAANQGTRLALQPWADTLVSTLLNRALDGRLSLRLLWPVEIDALAGLHAIASLYRVLKGELRGLRSLYYPGSRVTCTALDRIAIERRGLAALWRSFNNGAQPAVESSVVRAVLEACNHIELYHNEVSPPQLRQLTPAFMYEPGTKQWEHTKHLPLERLITKVVKLHLRDQLRERIETDWLNAAVAPGALLVLPRALKKRELREAFGQGKLHGAVKADVLLIDASTRSAAADARGIRRLPEFLKGLSESMSERPGGLIITDDPTEYFVLRDRLQEKGLLLDASVVAGEAESGDWLACALPKARAWVPVDRSLINISVTVLDQEAAILARRFGKIAEAVHDEELAVEEVFRVAQDYVIRSSHLPGGFVDLYSAEGGERDYLSRDLEWSRIEELIRKLLDRGSANTHRKQIEEAIARVREHLALCQNGTPLAFKLQEQVQRFVVDSRDGLTIILSSPRNIAVAHRFLERVLGKERWAIAQGRLEWLSLSQAAGGLRARSNHRRLVIVGLSPRILRLLATHQEIPVGTCLLVPLQRAIGATKVLEGLAVAPALRPYRARLSGFLATLKSQIARIPDISTLTRTLESTEAGARRYQLPVSTNSDPKAYRFHLEDGRWVQAASIVFQYEGGEGIDFKRVQARSIEPGDFVFEMSDELRDEIEQALTAPGEPVDTSPARKMLSLYRKLVATAVANLFSDKSRQGSLRQIKSRMVELDPKCSDISTGKLNYWVVLDESESAPHGPRDQEEFSRFCEALRIDSVLASEFWNRIRRVRYENQTEGRQLNAVYAQILFSPESAYVYQGLSQEMIRQLRTKALRCVYHVIEVQAPSG